MIRELLKSKKERKGTNAYFKNNDKQDDRKNVCDGAFCDIKFLAPVARFNLSKFSKGLCYNFTLQSSKTHESIL